jgi:CRP-like cAMP-binding protein
VAGQRVVVGERGRTERGDGRRGRLGLLERTERDLLVLRRPADPGHDPRPEPCQDEEDRRPHDEDPDVDHVGQTGRADPDEDGSYRSLSTMDAGDFFGEIAALTGSRRTATVVAEQPTTIVEVPAPALRALMAVPELSSIFLTKLTERLSRTNQADLPRFSGVDQASLRDLRTPRPSAEALPKSY